jgi:hypothetical protein
VSLAPIRTGRDGGMHPTFLAKLKPQEVREPDGSVRYVVDENASKKLGSYVNPPIETYPTDDTPTGTAVAARGGAAKQPQKPAPAATTYMTASAESRPAPAPGRAPAESSGGLSSLFASTNDSRSEGVFGRMKNSVGRLFGDDDKPAAPAPRPAAALPPPKPAATPQTAPAAAHAKPQSQPQEQAQEAPAPAAQAAQTPTRQSAASGASLMGGATPTVPTGSFNSRWGAIQ